MLAHDMLKGSLQGKLCNVVVALNSWFCGGISKHLNRFFYLKVTVLESIINFHCTLFV